MSRTVRRERRTSINIRSTKNPALHKLKSEQDISVSAYRRFDQSTRRGEKHFRLASAQRGTIKKSCAGFTALKDEKWRKRGGGRSLSADNCRTGPNKADDEKHQPRDGRRGTRLRWARLGLTWGRRPEQKKKSKADRPCSKSNRGE